MTLELSVLLIRAVSDDLEVLSFRTDTTTGCQTSKLVRPQWDPLSLQMKILRFFES